MKITQYLKIGRCLKEFRMDRGCSQKEMAHRLGLSVATYSNHENGYSNPSMEMLHQFCTDIGISVGDLLFYAIYRASAGREEGAAMRRWLGHQAERPKETYRSICLSIVADAKDTRGAKMRYDRLLEITMKFKDVLNECEEEL